MSLNRGEEFEDILLLSLYYLNRVNEWFHKNGRIDNF